MADCPQCRLPLRQQDYEGTSISFCETCWGHWLDDLSLATILAKREYGFSQGERNSAIASWVHVGDGGLENGSPGLPCPVCQRPMVESPFADDCPVLVDRCREHGTWLDAGEIKKIQVFVENR